MNALDIHRRDAENAEFPQRALTDQVIGAAIEVHRVLGPGLLESVYQHALQHELGLRNVPFEADKATPLVYKGAALKTPLRLDLLVAGQVVVEIKSVEQIDEIHRAQLLTYLRLTEMPTGLLINFNVPILKDGLKRVVNSPRPSAHSAPLR